MARWRTGLGLGLSLLGTMVLGTNCFAQTEERYVSAVPEKGSDERGSTKSEAEKARASLQPAQDWLDRENRVGLPLLKNIAEDQKALWIGPKSVRFADADWLVPLGGAAAAMFVTDSSYSRHLSNSPNRIKYSKDLSNYGLASMVGIGGGLYLWGHLTHDDHKIETGILAGEAAINTLVPVYAMKYAFGRERPLQDNYRGRFGQGGVSFPSEHAAAAWSIASVIAHEYPGPLTSLFVYGLASAVSASRVSGKQHFPSDVLVGSAIGWLEGMYVYRKHHDPRIGGGDWETYAESQADRERSTGNMGSPYVPLDSWIYPALERLIALGYINDAILGMRPWTRSECSRLVDEAQDRVRVDSAVSLDMEQLVDALAQEFVDESESSHGDNNRRLRLESLYTRITGISGPPLNDGYHFGKTIVNDYGRPYGEGFNTVEGFSAWTTSGRWVAYLRGEYQHSPSALALPQTARQFIRSVDVIPSVPPPMPVSETNRVQLLDAYVGTTVNNWQLTFGKQSLWWGPSRGGPLMFNDNAEPVNMFRINRVLPLKLPSIFGLLGPLRVELFVGQLAGHEFVSQVDTGIVGTFGRSLNRQPFIDGERFSFRPLSDLEFGFSVTAIFAGGPTPLTSYTLLKSYSIGNGNAIPGSKSDPGDRRSGFDFTFRVPGLRNRLTFYAEAFVEDEFSPIAYWNKAAIYSGLYMPRFLGLTKLDLRIEGGYTDLPSDVYHPSLNVFYTNTRYPNGYTNDGNLLGNWMGRQSQGAQGWATYHLNPRSFLEISYRHDKVSQEWMPGGGTLTDVSVATDYWIRRDWKASASIQFEHWKFPILANGQQTNVTSTVGIAFVPSRGLEMARKTDR